MHAKCGSPWESMARLIASARRKTGIGMRISRLMRCVRAAGRLGSLSGGCPRCWRRCGLRLVGGVYLPAAG